MFCWCTVQPPRDGSEADGLTVTCFHPFYRRQVAMAQWKELGGQGFSRRPRLRPELSDAG
jgi:hypothetical protein